MFMIIDTTRFSVRFGWSWTIRTVVVVVALSSRDGGSGGGGEVFRLVVNLPRIIAAILG